ncbi:hypothetical protein LTR08_006191 [Meristemomyces frigidus]|nr:hypothetical protein LTR08_006191 [Meristemomyces frigidus]
MSSQNCTTTLPSAPRSTSGHTKLHKRAHSGSSTGPPSPFVGAHSQFTTPFATYEESFPDAALKAPVSSTPRIKPYSRKTSGNANEDQGKLDLSKATIENDRLAGLGIQGFGTRSVSDVSFAHAGRRGAHARTTSVGSQVSTSSATWLNQPFVHPMRQTPRPYTPPTGSSNASFVNEDEADESGDVIDDDFRLGHGFKSRRSMSMSSTPAMGAPTPLSQSHTAEELGIVPKLTNRSQTNLSIKSGRSAKSSKSRLGRPRRDTGRSTDLTTSPSSRTSFDKAFSLVSRKSDTDPQTRDERIRAARQKFEEKEAHKDRRTEKEQSKRRETSEAKSAKNSERLRRKSESENRARVPKPSNSNESRTKALKKTVTRQSIDDEKLHSRSYDEHRPANHMSLPRKGVHAGASEKTSHARDRSKSHGAQSGWVRFSAWLQTRMLSCGDER